MISTSSIDLKFYTVDIQFLLLLRLSYTLIKTCVKVGIHMK
jgi:hypothetical protein